MKYLFAILALMLLCSAAMATDTAPVNLTVDKYAFAYFPVTTEAADYATYSADPANNTSNFAITIPAASTEGQDTVNMIWGCNTPARITISFTPGDLPGTWAMAFDGAGWTGPNQAFDTEDPKDIGKLMVVPITLKVTGIGLAVRAKSYAGALNIASVTPL